MEIVGAIMNDQMKIAIFLVCNVIKSRPRIDSSLSFNVLLFLGIHTFKCERNISKTPWRRTLFKIFFFQNSSVKERDRNMHYQQMRYERPIDWGTKWVLCRIKHQSNINGNCTFSIRPFGTWNLFVIYSQLHFAQQLDVDGFHFASLRSALSAQLICAPYLFLFVCVFFQTFRCTNVQVSNRFLHGTRVFSVHLVFNWLSISLDHDLNEFLYRNEKMTGVHTVWVCEEERASYSWFAC